MYIGTRKNRREKAFFLTLGVTMVLIPFIFALSFGVPFASNSKGNFAAISQGPRQNVVVSTDERAWIVDIYVPVTEQDTWTSKGGAVNIALHGSISLGVAGEIVHLDQNITLDRRDGVVLSIERDKPGPFRVLQRYNGYRVEFFRPGLVGKRIAIDPGHGGHDPGAVYPQGTWNPQYMEKTVTLDVSLELKRLLEEAGAVVFMTRETDELVDTSVQPGQNIRPDLWKRRDIVEGWFPDFFVSVHVNSWRDNSAYGTETFYNPDSFNRYASLAAARCIQPRLVAEFQRRDRGITAKSDAVLQSNDYAAVLVELLFITNYTDRQILFSPDFPQRAARAIFEGIEEYFGRGETD